MKASAPDKFCKGCGNRFSPNTGRQVYCGKCPRRKGKVQIEIPMTLEEWEVVEAAHDDVARRVREHNMRPSPVLLATRYRAVADAYMGRDSEALTGALRDLAAIATQWSAVSFPARLRAPDVIPVKNNGQASDLLRGIAVAPVKAKAKSR